MGTTIMKEDTHMANSPPNHDKGGDTGVGSGTPRWVKVFGIIVIVLVLLIGIIMFTGLGGQHGPGRHMPSGGLTLPSSGHVNISRIGGPADTALAARTVEVTTLDTMTFEPNRLNVSAGEMVTFVVTNSGQALHEFTLGGATMQQQHAGEIARMADAMAHNAPNSIRLQPGETRRLTWRFGDTATLEYGCHEPGHEQAGMRGQISITLTLLPTEVQQP
jgi:uncharacterized cupredoxin-like copper-binding protein